MKPLRDCPLYDWLLGSASGAAAVQQLCLGLNWTLARWTVAWASPSVPDRCRAP